jgi:hypothetical protein
LWQKVLLLLLLLTMMICFIWRQSNHHFPLHDDVAFHKSILAIAPVAEIAKFHEENFPALIRHNQNQGDVSRTSDRPILFVTAANFAYVTSGLVQNMLCSLRLLHNPRFLSHMAFLPLDTDTSHFLRLHYPDIITFSSPTYWQGITEVSFSFSYHLPFLVVARTNFKLEVSLISSLSLIGLLNYFVDFSLLFLSVFLLLESFTY